MFNENEKVEKELKKIGEQFAPKDLESGESKYGALVFKIEETALKFYPAGSLTDSEKKELAEKLSKEFQNTVVLPFKKLVLDFYKKYEIAPCYNKSGVRGVGDAKLYLILEAAEKALQSITPD